MGGGSSKNQGEPCEGLAETLNDMGSQLIKKNLGGKEGDDQQLPENQSPPT